MKYIKINFLCFHLDIIPWNTLTYDYMYKINIETSTMKVITYKISCNVDNLKRQRI